MPLVSVIIPTYNRPELLRLTLESVHNQTFSDLEVLVVDDGTPNSENEVLCQEFPKVRYFKIENSGGPSKPRNLGIQNSSGKYLAFVDDDDLWLPHKLETQVKILEENLEYGLVHSPCKVIDYQGLETGVIIGRPGTPDVKHGDVKLRMIGNWTLMMSSVLIRKKIASQVGYFNTKMPQAGEDAEYWSRCSFYTKFYYLDEPLAFYREHQSNSKLLKNEYVEQPQYLKITLLKARKDGLITKKEYHLLLNNVVRKQLRAIPKRFRKSIINLFKLDPFWLFNVINLKLFVVMISRKLTIILK